jgi:hypothetical protein
MSKDLRIVLRDPLEIQRAHDILHAVAIEEIDLHFSEVVLSHCHTAHDVLGWILGFECGESFVTHLQAIERAAEAAGYVLRDQGGQPVTDAERRQR